MLLEREPELIADLRVFTPLLRRLNDLKRLKTADASDLSLAQRWFARAWTALSGGESPTMVALRETTAAVAAVELGGIDVDVLRRSGLCDTEIVEVFRRAVERSTSVFSMRWRECLKAAVPSLLQPAVQVQSPPNFVTALQHQPRAGATHPIEPRLVLEPPESHADHCYVVGVTAVLLAGHADTDIEQPFLAALSHHLHNAVLPDAGFAGEALLGEYLTPMIRRLTAEALNQLPPNLAQRVTRSQGLLDHPHNPPAQAFHAADVIDRVLEAAHYDQVACFRLDDALGRLELVHPGPLKPFQDRVLAAAGLIA